MKDLEQAVKKHMVERRWDNMRPADLAKSIMIEGAELLEHFQWENLSAEEVKKQTSKLEEIKGELADVMIYCLELSIGLGFDTKKIIQEKLIKVAKKYPAKLMSRRPKEESEADSDYYRIKKKHRRHKIS